MLVFLVVVMTSTVQPFSDELKQQHTLQSLEMASLMAIFLTLWAGSVFFTFPKCEDPQMGQGQTLAWCDVLSVTVGLTDFIILVTLVMYFVSVKFAGKGAGEVIGGAGGIIGTSLFRALSRKRQRGGEQKTEGGETKNDKEVAATDIELTSVVSEEAEEAKDKRPTLDRLSSIFDDSSGESSGDSSEDEVKEEEWESLVDPDTGKVYLFNQATGESKWVQDENEDEPVVQTRINPLVESEEQKDDASDWEYIENDPPYWYNAKTEESRWA